MQRMCLKTSGTKEACHAHISKSIPGRISACKDPMAWSVTINYANWSHSPSSSRISKLGKTIPALGIKTMIWKYISNLCNDFKSSQIQLWASTWNRQDHHCHGSPYRFLDDTFRTCHTLLLNNLVHIVCLWVENVREGLKLKITLFKTTLIQGL